MASKKKIIKPKFQSFQDTILNLQKYWGKHGCVILQPYDIEVGAGTFHPATTLRSLGPKPWKAAYVQPSRRPTDGRYGENPNRLQHYYQFQVLIKPSPDNIKKLYLNSLAVIGINHKEHDIRFVEDDWESPTLGAAGLGWEVWCDGMEITQFTYFQQMAGFECIEFISFGLGIFPEPIAHTGSYAMMIALNSLASFKAPIICCSITLKVVLSCFSCIDSPTHKIGTTKLLLA